MLLKSSACLLAFIAFYKLFLERTSNHQFKRYYLLFVVFTSIAIPFITFIEYIEPQTVLENYSLITNPSETINIQNTKSKNYLLITLWSIYGLGVLLLTARFAYNLRQIFQKIKRNPKQKASNIINVLLQDRIVPHTFFNYIFLNKTKFENREIPNEVLLHEETHARQKHSLDIIFIELLQIIFWFHPLVYILKKDMKLNHEFLADQAVINQGINTTAYQELLLACSSHAAINPMAHAINYSLIKKRLTVMKTKTSKKSLWLRSLLLLPLLGVLVYGFSSTKQIEKENITSSNHYGKHLIIMAQINSVSINGKPSSIETFKLDIDKETKDWEESDFNVVIPDLKIASCSQEFLDKLDTEFKKTDYSSKTLRKVNFVKPKSKKQIQQKATPEQIAKYNKLASYYNKMIQEGGKMKFYSKDVAQLKRIYSLMSDTQRKNAEPFPNFPKPPPPPKAKSMEASNIPPPPPPIPANATPKQKAKYKKTHEEYNKRYKIVNGEVKNRMPPPPPPPKSPLDHAIDMAKKGAIFYYNGKKVSSDKAISLLKQDQELNLSTQNVDSKKPIVNITTNPVITDNDGKVITKVETLSEIKANTNLDRHGYVDINGTTYFYSIKNKIITYYNRWGKKVNDKGELIH